MDAFVEGGRDFRYLEMRALSDRERGVLMERHLISPELMGNPSAAVLLSTDETRSIMMNEEDHLRIQCILPGLQLRESYKSAAQMARTVEAKHAFAFDDRLGYLTCCPTNVGTGMRASVMVRLPALTLSGQIKGILDSIGKMGLTVRGIYGEGSEALGLSLIHICWMKPAAGCTLSSGPSSWTGGSCAAYRRMAVQSAPIPRPTPSCFRPISNTAPFPAITSRAPI